MITMNELLLIYIPIVITIAWATLCVKQRMNTTEAALVALIGVIIVANGLIKHFELTGSDIPDAAIVIQQVLSSLIIPFTYSYFARQVGRPIINEISVLLVSLLLLLLFPNIVVFYDTSQPVSNVSHMSLLIVGKEQHAYTISDLVIAIQSVITAIRVLPLYRLIKRYGLSLSMDVKRFMAWWCIAVIFVVFASYNSERGDYNYIIDVICKIGFMLIVTRAFYKIGHGFDLRPIVSKEQPVELSEFMSQSRDLAKRLTTIIERGDILSAGYSADNAIQELGTNRTYFFKMVKAEYRCTFSELMNRERVSAVKSYLMNTNDSLAVISERCGFSNTSYMVKVFKQLEGVTPGMWREKNSIKKS